MLGVFYIYKDFFIRFRALKNINRIHDKELTVIPADTRHQPGYSKREKKVSSEPKERSCEQSSPSSSVEVYPLVHRISDNCLTNIFQYLPIVDRVRVEGGIINLSD